MRRLVTHQNIHIRFKRPHRQAPTKGIVFKGFEILVEDESVQGEKVNGNAIWHRSGDDYYWSGGLTEVSTAPPPQPVGTPLPFRDWRSSIAFKAALPAWMNKTGKNIRIAVLDDGILRGHPALQDATNHGEHKDFITAGSGGGQTHGTRCAGIIAARSSPGAGGIIGIAPDATLIDARVIGPSSGVHTVQEAIEWFSQPGRKVDIFSMSFDLIQSDSTLAALVESRTDEGFVFVASAGDLSELSSGQNALINHLSFPASVDACLSIGILNTRAFEDLRSRPDVSFAGTLDFVAPAARIYTTDVQGRYSEEAPGSSFAAPFVAGLAALVLEHFDPGGNRAAFVKQRLAEVAVDFGNIRFDTVPFQPLVIPR